MKTNPTHFAHRAAQARCSTSTLASFVVGLMLLTASTAPADPGDGQLVVFDPNGGGRSFAGDLYVEAGNLGLGDAAPEHRLVVDGDVTGSGRVAFGNDSEIGPGASIFDEIFEFAHIVTDFSGVDSWRLFKSLVTVDPETDLTGADSKAIIGNSFDLQTPFTNDRDFDLLYGGSMGAFHLGTGRVEVLSGAFASAQLGDGDVGLQSGLLVTSIAAIGGTIETNRGIAIETGHFGTGGAIVDNTGIVIQRPHNAQPITTARGLHLEDHGDVAAESWAIYAEGGRSYHAGYLGLGVADPQSALQVDGYVHLDLTAGAPPAGDCDEASEAGRLQVDATAGLLYVCVDSGWVAK